MGAMAGNPDEEVPEVQEETSRLAILDLDWSKVDHSLRLPHSSNCSRQDSCRVIVYDKILTCMSKGRAE